MIVGVLYASLLILQNAPYPFKYSLSTNMAIMKHHLFKKKCLGKSHHKSTHTGSILTFLKVVIIFTLRHLGLLSFLSESCWRFHYRLEISTIRHSTKSDVHQWRPRKSFLAPTWLNTCDCSSPHPHLTFQNTMPPLQHCHPKGFSRWWKWYRGTPSEAGCKCQRGSELMERSVWGTHMGSKHTEGCSERICPRVRFWKKNVF